MSGCACTGPWEQLPISSPYPPLEALQQKRLAARRHKTTYCYDFPSVFSNALRQAWLARAIAGEPGDVPRGVFLLLFFGGGVCFCFCFLGGGGVFLLLFLGGGGGCAPR